MAELKKVLRVHDPGSQHWVGDGFHVRNMFPSNGVEDEINPFLMLDYAGPTEVQPGPKPRRERSSTAIPPDTPAPSAPAMCSG